MKLQKVLSILLAFVLAAGLAACAAPTDGQSAQPSSPSASSAQSESSPPPQAPSRPAADRSGNAITVPEQVRTIVSLAPATTQVLCDLGLAERLVAVDTNSPAYAQGLAADIVQLNLLEPDLEQLLARDADILFVSPLSSQGGEDIFQPLRDAGLCVAEIPTSNTIADVKLDVQFIADCVGKSAEGAALLEDMQRTFDEVSAIGRTIDQKKTVLFEISPLPYIYSFGQGVYLNEMLILLGAENVLADQQGWLAVTEESAVAANPDVILTNDNFSGTDPAAEILARSGWENVTAVRERAVFYIDNGSSSLPNHHVAQALVEMAKAIYPEAYAALN